MEIGSVIMGIITLAFFIVPVVYLQKVQKSERKAFLKDFNIIAGQQQLKITEQDFWNHCYAIGMDAGKNQLFYLKKKEGIEQKVSIDLSEVEACNLININRNVDDNRIVDLLALSFTFRNPKKPVKTLEFYNNAENMALHNELELLEKWKALVSSKLQELARQNNHSDSKNKLVA